MSSLFDSMAARVAPQEFPERVPSKTDWILENYQRHYLDAYETRSQPYQFASNDTPSAPPVPPPEPPKRVGNTNCLLYFYYADLTNETAGYLNRNGTYDGYERTKCDLKASSVVNPTAGSLDKFINVNVWSICETRLATAIIPMKKFKSRTFFF